MRGINVHACAMKLIRKSGKPVSNGMPRQAAEVARAANTSPAALVGRCNLHSQALSQRQLLPTTAVIRNCTREPQELLIAITSNAFYGIKYSLDHAKQRRRHEAMRLKSRKDAAKSTVKMVNEMEH